MSIVRHIILVALFLMTLSPTLTFGQEGKETEDWFVVRVDSGSLSYLTVYMNPEVLSWEKVQEVGREVCQKYDDNLYCDVSFWSDPAVPERYFVAYGDKRRSMVPEAAEAFLASFSIIGGSFEDLTLACYHDPKRLCNVDN